MNLAYSGRGYIRLNCTYSDDWVLDATRDMSSVNVTLSDNFGWSGKDVLSDTQHCWCLIYLYRPLGMRPVRRIAAAELKKWRLQIRSIHSSIKTPMTTAMACFDDSLNNE